MAIKHSSGVMVEHWDMESLVYIKGVKSTHHWLGWVTKAHKDAGDKFLMELTFDLPDGTAPTLASGAEGFSTAGLKLQAGFENAEEVE